jgi:hypothetical protein
MADTKQEAVVDTVRLLRGKEKIEREKEIAGLSIGSEYAFGVPEKITSISQSITDSQ